MTEPHAIDVQVGENLRCARRAAGWSQERLAVAIGVSSQQLQKYETGANRISASKLFDACKALGVRPSVLFGTPEPAEDVRVNRADLQLAACIQRLQPVQQRAVRDVIDVLQPAAPDTV